MTTSATITQVPQAVSFRHSNPVSVDEPCDPLDPSQTTPSELLRARAVPLRS